MAKLRPDLDVIASWVPESTKVLDIGCGEGLLLRHLAQEKQVNARGMELDMACVRQCVASGLSAFQGDADEDLVHYPDAAFDVAILSVALQMMQRPKDVLAQMARIGGQVIVSIPNFGHWKSRGHLFFKGRMPVTSSLTYQWYDTPNIHFCTIRDFRHMAKELNLRITKQLYLNEDGEAPSYLQRPELANWMADKAVFLLEEA